MCVCGFCVRYAFGCQPECLLDPTRGRPCPFGPSPSKRPSSSRTPREVDKTQNINEIHDLNCVGFQFLSLLFLQRRPLAWPGARRGAFLGLPPSQRMLLPGLSAALVRPRG